MSTDELDDFFAYDESEALTEFDEQQGVEEAFTLPVLPVAEALKTYFGFDSLRKGQDEVVDAVMAGRDVMAIMPTGGGKSLCYQLPALCREGLVLVVSPLIALMKDQVDALVAKGIPAAAIHSGLGADEYRQVMNAFYRDELKILYVAPERLGQGGFINALSNKQISLLAIDEAHCLSQWGHDFRPDYMRLGRVREVLGNPQTIALTATATEQVRLDVLNTLKLQEPAVIISGFARENLDFAIIPCNGRAAKFDRLRYLVQTWKTGIIYCSTRKTVMTVFAELNKGENHIVAYHAGMTDEERSFAQESFISGRADVVVATNAFGMGIDRADVRFVAHFEVPGSVEAYYQEAGRAGRDGERGVCELLFNHADLKTQEFFFEGSNPPLDLIRRLYSFLCENCAYETNELQMTVDAMAENMGKDVNGMALGSALSILIHAGAISRFDVPGRNGKGTRVNAPNKSFAMLGIDQYALEEKANRDHLKIESVTKFAYTTSCRQQWILNYFGEKDTKPCGHCDACVSSAPDDAQEPSPQQLEIIRKALSGVARASRRLADGTWEGIYGRSKIIGMLRGSKGANMHGWLINLSTYGLLAELTEAQLKELFAAMTQVGLLTVSGGEMPLVSLSAKGQDVMLGKDVPSLSLRWVSAAPRGQKKLAARKEIAMAEIAAGRMDKELYERLSELRRDIADEKSMPVYRIMSNETLRTMARIKPLTSEAACRIKGIGPWTRDNILASFLELIADFEEK